MKKDIRLSILGYDTETKAVVEMIEKGGLPPQNISIFTQNWEQTEKLCEKYGWIKGRDVFEAAYYSDFVFIQLSKAELMDAVQEEEEIFKDKVSILIGNEADGQIRELTEILAEKGKLAVVSVSDGSFNVNKLMGLSHEEEENLLLLLGL